ncbi:MAG: MerR family transcriptional regulator [Actinobacteria bacterium]|nr:MAG: MerR family transcriptional regulator [Actinomycetota bacterium]
MRNALTPQRSPRVTKSWLDGFTSSSRTAMSDTDQLSIGEVINQLRDEFPDVSVSKIRFLESQGLLDPDRTSSGYRQFGPDEIARIRFILQQQRDHFLPLKVIKSKLTLWERGEEVAPSRSASKNIESTGEPLSRDDVLKRSSLDESQLDALIEAKVINPMADSDVFPAETGVIALEARRLLELGLEARHLRAVKLAVDRESELLRQLVEPLLRANNAEAQERARDTLTASNDSVQAMHKAMLRGELRRFLTT